MNVRIVEVGPRDGLQNEPVVVPTDTKLRFIGQLARTGLKEIEATSFVSPKWIPQLADAEELWTALPPGAAYSALVPNAHGLDRAVSLGVKRIALFTAASDEFCRRNINMSLEESLTKFEQLIKQFRGADGDWIRGYVSTAFECPYEGIVPTSKVVEVARRLVEMGVDEVSLGDTIGVAVPREVNELTRAILAEIPIEKVGFHFHDTRGTGIANVSEALDQGIRTFDSSAGGLGGCPYAPGAGGNVATEDLVYFLERTGITTGVDLAAVSEASLEVLEVLGRQPGSKAQLATLSCSSEGQGASRRPQAR